MRDDHGITVANKACVMILFTARKRHVDYDLRRGNMYPLPVTRTNKYRNSLIPSKGDYITGNDCIRPMVA